MKRNGRLGVRLAADQPPQLIAGDLDRLDLVALEFPTFRDGRAYSYARLLRERYGFKKELRAVGNVLRDQFRFMHRCGFDAYAVADEKQAAAWARALSEISVVYQPSTDRRRPISTLRGLPAAIGKRRPVLVLGLLSWCKPVARVRAHGPARAPRHLRR